MSTASCKRCDSAMQLEPLADVRGNDGDVNVRFPALPALKCTRGHRRFVMPEFPMMLLEKLSGEIRLPAGKAKGLLIKHYHCGECDARLAGSASASRTYEFDIALKGIEPFRVELTVPVYACPSCKREQVRSLDEIAKQTPAAMAHAFQAAEIPPG